MHSALQDPVRRIVGPDPAVPGLRDPRTQSYWDAALVRIVAVAVVVAAEEAGRIPGARQHLWVTHRGIPSLVHSIPDTAATAHRESYRGCSRSLGWDPVAEELSALFPSVAFLDHSHWLRQVQLQHHSGLGSVGSLMDVAALAFLGQGILHPGDTN